IENWELWNSLNQSETVYLASGILWLIRDLGAMLNTKLDYAEHDQELHSQSLGSLAIQSKVFPVNDAEDRLAFNFDWAQLEMPFGALENSTLVNGDMSNITA